MNLTIFSKTNKFSKKSGIILCFFLQISLTSGFVEESWILMSASALGLLYIQP